MDPLVLFAIFSTIIMMMTVFFILRVLHIAYKRGEITFRKLVTFGIISILCGVMIVPIFLIGFQKIIEVIA